MIERQIDDPEVGSGGQRRFKPGVIPQRVTIAPKWCSEESLRPNVELQRRAEQGDPDAVEAVIRLDRMRSIREQTASPTSKTRPPTAIRHEIDGKPGYLYIPTYAERSHYFDGIGRFVCKTDQWRFEEKIGPDDYAPCCEHNNREKGPELEVALLLVYGTSPAGEVNELPPAQQRPLDAENRLYFSYRYLVWGLAPNQINTWKGIQANAPLINHDYIIVKAGPDKFARINFNPCAESLWRGLGPLMVKRILRETAEYDGTIRNEFGRDFELPEDQQQVLDAPVPQAVPSQPRTPQGNRGFLSP
jgi:hypothetical protein